MKIPVIIDADPGVDDCYAIAMANAHKNFDIRAITAVEGNVGAEKTRYNCLCVADTLDIPCRVGFGAETPLKKRYDSHTTSVHGENGIGETQLPKPNREPDAKPAWDIIYEEAVRCEGTLILVAIGPLTNVALALRKYPDLPRYLKHIYIMGGGLFGNVTPKAEFNIWVDPTAAKEVFEKMQVHMVGLNATHQIALTDEEFDELIDRCDKSNRNGFLQELLQFSKQNSVIKNADSRIMHDALVIASIIDDTVVHYEKHKVYVEDNENAINEGETVVLGRSASEKEQNCWVAMDVDKNRFFEILIQTCEYYSQ